MNFSRYIFHSVLFSPSTRRALGSIHTSVLFLYSPDSIGQLRRHTPCPPVDLMYIPRQQPPFCFIKHEVVSFPMCDPRTAVYAETGCLIVRRVETPDSLSPHCRRYQPPDLTFATFHALISCRPRTLSFSVTVHGDL